MGIFNGANFAAFVAMFASPVAVSTVPMAQSMGADHALAGQLVVWTTLISSLVIFPCSIYFEVRRCIWININLQRKKAKIVSYPAQGLFEFSGEDAVQSMSAIDTQGLDSVLRALPQGASVWVETEDTFRFQGLRPLVLNPG